MAGNHPSTSPSTSTNHDSPTKVTDMDMDSLVHCTSYLTLQDISNLAVSCKFFNRVVYSDSVWRRLYRDRWPQVERYISPQTSGLRKAYLARYRDLQQFRFVDPFDSIVSMEARSCDLILSKNSVYVSQGPLIRIYSIEKLLEGNTSFVSLNDHRARITSMRALLWDIRKNTGTGEVEPMAELIGHMGPVTQLHMDPYKVVTGGPEDPQVTIWSADTGYPTNDLICSPLDSIGCVSMAADGFRIVTAGYDQEHGILRFRDFSKAVWTNSGFLEYEQGSLREFKYLGRE